MSGYSLHIGLNHCDPNAYPGWDSTLSGCINDANSMMQLASTAGFRTRRMIDGEATSNAVLSAIGNLGRTCQPGDIALISYSGHGGQVPDTNGDEDDGQDETWVLYDRQVADDELNQVYSQFAAGVRILVVSDSCHSGTVARQVINLATRHAVATNQVGKDLWPVGVTVEEAKPRFMPYSIAKLDADRKKSVYSLVQTLTRNSKNPDLAASLILLSGCQDNQTSFDGTVNGAFTTALLQVWNQGRFSGDYRSFHTAIQARMPADQTPNFYTLGDVSTYQTQRPFSLDASSSGSSGPTGATRPQLQQGSRGPDVVYLQQRLAVHGYPLGADGIFGAATAQAVRTFQTTKGITADGIVGPVTWRALEASPPDVGTSGTWDTGGGQDDGGWDGGGGGQDGGGWDGGGGDGGDGGGGGQDDGGWDGGWDGGGDGGGGQDDGGWDGGDGGGDGGGGQDDGGWDGGDGGDGGGGQDDGGWDGGDGGDGGGGQDDGGWDGGDGDGGDGGQDDGGGWGDDRAARSGPAATARPVVRQGDSGQHVRTAQSCLRTHGYRGPVDGRFTARMATAVRIFQKSQGLPNSGVIDQATWRAIEC
ncbi:caspase family protein [Nocardioides islandensis]|uniref:Caspase family protein n=1 Tax=Nocardioides islandensis TaxID=433663 RepID=A0A930VJP3_9ACTN|nr:peptidoglycan-binding protein [Nocardioides islandensis]MBF4765115.1 caspase family protein [Nocardioides islandensis]